METDKLQALATAIKAVFDQDGQDIAVFANDKIPRGYLARIKQTLPLSYQWPKDESNVSRLIVQNKQNILKLLNNNTITGSALNDRVSEFFKSATNEHSEQKSVEHSEDSEYPTRSEVDAMIREAVKRAVLQINPTSLQSSFMDFSKLINSDEPLPTFLQTRRTGRKRKDEVNTGRQWEKLQTSVDKRLFELFCREADERHLNRSQMLDMILSERYGSKTD